MRLIQIATLAALLAFAPTVKAATQPKAQPPAESVAERLSKATLAVYRGQQVCKWEGEPSIFGMEYEWTCKFESRFTCTATVVDGSTGKYVGLTAGHCFDWAEKDHYYVADTVEDEPVLRHIKLEKFEDDDRYDYAIFTFDSIRDYPAMPIDTGNPPTIGTKVVNINFALGLTKQEMHGVVESAIATSPIPRLKIVKGRYLVNIGIGGGASGSAVVDEATGKIVGIVELAFPGTQMPTGVMPTGQTLVNFMDDDSAGLRPLPPVGAPPAAPAPPEIGTESLWHHIVRIVEGFFLNLF